MKHVCTVYYRGREAVSYTHLDVYKRQDSTYPADVLSHEQQRPDQDEDDAFRTPKTEPHGGDYYIQK